MHRAAVVGLSVFAALTLIVSSFFVVSGVRKAFSGGSCGDLQDYFDGIARTAQERGKALGIAESTPSAGKVFTVLAELESIYTNSNPPPLAREYRDAAVSLLHFLNTAGFAVALSGDLESSTAPLEKRLDLAQETLLANCPQLRSLEPFSNSTPEATPT